MTYWHVRGHVVQLHYEAEAGQAFLAWRNGL